MCTCVRKNEGQIAPLSSFSLPLPQCPCFCPLVHTEAQLDLVGTYGSSILSVLIIFHELKCHGNADVGQNDMQLLQ